MANEKETVEKVYEGVVQDICPSKHKGEGFYAVVTCDGIKGGSITFHCKFPVWTGKHEPRPGEIVLLSDVHGTTSGWRAEKASPKTPD